MAKDQKQLVYKDAGVKKLGEYLELARKAGIICLGGSSHYAWASLVDQPLTVSSSTVPPIFATLVQLLRHLHETEGYSQVLWSMLGMEVHIKGPSLYAKAGVSTLKEYIALAVKEGIAEVGSNKYVGSEWIALKPAWRKSSDV
jgi:hypothetical protein